MSRSLTGRPSNVRAGVYIRKQKRRISCEVKVRRTNRRGGEKPLTALMFLIIHNNIGRRSLGVAVRSTVNDDIMLYYSCLTTAGEVSYGRLPGYNILLYINRVSRMWLPAAVTTSQHDTFVFQAKRLHAIRRDRREKTKYVKRLNLLITIVIYIIIKTLPIVDVYTYYAVVMVYRVTKIVYRHREHLTTNPSPPS